MSNITLIRTNSDLIDFRQLVALLDKDLAIRDGDDHAFYSQFNKIDAIKEVVVAYQNEISIGCGAIKPFSNTAVEIKRMFVHPDYRNQGIAAKMLNVLEGWALELGYTECVLETGKMQPEAIALYQKVGYQITPNYGQYIGVDNSVCMAKLLNTSQTA
ncbi:N-acetylglutamate synthase-like GNAT family acetyltransferase [Pedobacter psychrotolerans]|uniref:N-acetylglutamate synthase-like GNAT family acetyltransferase n=1 Tax=Pedobacter psychrotolerans TaxID=1843235 RepID=A0A4R2HFW5_9SPHI|nr:GNAT family N-acetyltransferase [Pedobacter psychrotolerans]TCO26927.1 N-acetylglutamate synthase-like GNAT family acetyltransferase [Pedobacter psychrotolerans]GGE57588.1 N-acetyltransferase [Pedobacter psychrotolerans]